MKERFIFRQPHNETVPKAVALQSTYRKKSIPSIHKISGMASGALGFWGQSFFGNPM